MLFHVIQEQSVDLLDPMRALGVDVLVVQLVEGFKEAASSGDLVLS